jgi:hypothetical protein
MLGGLEDLPLQFYVERVDLACMGQMLGRKAWMFHYDREELGTFKEPFVLSTSIEDLLDTWGGWISLKAGDKNEEVFVHTGGGLITSAEDSVGEASLLRDEIFCHWKSEINDADALPVLKHQQLLIGATTINQSCSLTTTACQRLLTNSLLPLGTRDPSWKHETRTVGFSGGYYANLNASGSWKRDDGRNLKKVIIEEFLRKPDLRALNSPWGLELSLCTGIARRVQLRHLIYGEVLEYIALGSPGEWSAIETEARRVSEMTDEEFEQLLRTMKKEERDVFLEAAKSLLIAMEATGVGSDGHTLTLWWPERNAPRPRAIQIVKSQYAGKVPWIAMIRDSSESAVFALATPRCLTHDTVKECRNATGTPLLQPHTQLKDVVLDTTLTPAESALQSLPYKEHARYQLWKRTDVSPSNAVLSEYT